MMVLIEPKEIVEEPLPDTFPAEEGYKPVMEKEPVVIKPPFQPEAEKEDNVKPSNLEYCEGLFDKHNWDRLGIDPEGYIVFQCTNCEKCKRQKICYVEGGCYEQEGQET